MSRKDIVIYSDIHISIYISRYIGTPVSANISAFQAIYEFYFSILIYRDITLSITRHILRCITMYIYISPYMAHAKTREALSFCEYTPCPFPTRQRPSGHAPPTHGLNSLTFNALTLMSERRNFWDASLCIKFKKLPAVAVEDHALLESVPWKWFLWQSTMNFTRMKRSMFWIFCDSLVPVCVWKL